MSGFVKELFNELAHKSHLMIYLWTGVIPLQLFSSQWHSQSASPV